MDLPEYIFSKESEIFLLEFLSSANDKIEITEFPYPSPTHNEFQNELKGTATETIIAISDSDASSVKSEEAVLLIDANDDINDLVETVKEKLESEKVVDENTIRNLANKCSKEQLQDILSDLSESLDLELIYNLGRSICLSKLPEKDYVAVYFCRHVLIHKLIQENSTRIEELMCEYFENFSSIISQELSMIVTSKDNKCLTLLQKKLTALPSIYKQIILSQCLATQFVLESHHLLILQLLVTANSDLEDMKKLINLMLINAETFSRSKDFGKLLIEVIKVVGRNYMYVDDQLREITNKHKSVWKNQAQQALNACAECSLLSQSFL